jgi:hypothetical protein
MVQLTDWIAKLQPHMVAVWLFQGWNMTYNISVKFKSHEDRWHWVKRGMELMRDQGLKYNPNETKIYREISWDFQHKIGANLDDAHMRYKLRWAQEMQNVLGGRPDFNELLNPTTPEWKERVRKLKEVYKMDPKVVQQVDEEYGPFDWRLPDAHAVYWAELGRIYGRPEDQETLRRSVYQSLQQMSFRGGALDSSITNWTEQNFILWPNLDQIPVINSAYFKMIGEETNNPHGLQQNMQTAHKNFVKQAIYLLYEDGREHAAEQWFNYLKSTYTNAFVGKEANMSLDDWAVSQVMSDMNDTDQNKTEAAIQGMFDREFYYLIHDNTSQAANYSNMAKKIWNHYTKKIGKATDPRLALKPIAQLQQFAFDRLTDPKSRRLTPQDAARLRSALGLPPAPAAPPAAEPAPDGESRS